MIITLPSVMGQDMGWMDWIGLDWIDWIGFRYRGVVQNVMELAETRDHKADSRAS